jgi:hypothetical protein
MLCVAVFLFPMTAYAASDGTPPDITARITGDLLHAEASDRDSGVEAVYINGVRYNYLVDGAIDAPLRDCAGTGEYITVHAVDFAGNKSKTVELENPYYNAPAPTPGQTPTTPAPTPQPAPPAPAPSPAPRPAQTPAANTPAPSDNPGDGNGGDASESAIGEGDVVFTPEGTGTVVDIATDEDGKLFYTIVTPAGNVFYLIIDLARTDGNNVYFLNAVTEADLAALAETDGSATGNESAIPVPEPTPKPDPAPQPGPAPEPEPEMESGGMGTVFLIVLAVAAIGGAGWYFKIYKPKRDAAMTDDDFDENEDEAEGEEAEDEIQFENPPEETGDGPDDDEDEE